MLKSLHISNYILIDELTIIPSAGLNTITGETGSGKSIILDALGLLLGKRADTKMIRNQENKCVIEGVFNIENRNLEAVFKLHDLDYDENTILRREILPSSKTRAFINDVPVTLDVLNSISSSLIDIHSQHQTLDFSKKSEQLFFIDTYASNDELLKKYRLLFTHFQENQKKLNELLIFKNESEKEIDYLQFLLKEFSELELENCNLEELEQELSVAQNAENIKISIYKAISISKENEASISQLLKEVLKIVQSISSFSSKIQEQEQRLENICSEFEDIVFELEQKLNVIDIDQEKIVVLTDKINFINKLLKKHQVINIEELIETKNKVSNKLETIENNDEAIEELKNTIDKQASELMVLANQLSMNRVASFQPLEKNIIESLKDLGIPNAAIEFKRDEKELSPDGIDNIELYFSANKGMALQTLKQAASGGEFSRMMFVVKYILAEKTKLASIVFDEIDTGVSGEIALKLASMMKKISKNIQLFSITHLPQIAARGDEQFSVYKTDIQNITTTNIKKLSAIEREVEIAKMLSGNKPTEVAFQNAKELLYLAL